jgi:tetratricopeptide (TPR) repeat protein
MQSEIIPQAREVRQTDKNREMITAPREEKRERPTGVPERTPRNINNPSPVETKPPRPTVTPPPVNKQKVVPETVEPHPEPILLPVPLPVPVPNGGWDKVDREAPQVYERDLSPFDEFYEQGIVYYDSGYYNEALVEFDNAMDIDTAEYQLYYYRGCTLLKLDYYEDAIADLNVYIKFFPEDRDALFNRGLAWFYFNNKETAYRDFDAASKLGDARAKSLIRRFY